MQLKIPLRTISAIIKSHMAEIVGNLLGIGPMSTPSLHTDLVDGGGGRKKPKYYSYRSAQFSRLWLSNFKIDCFHNNKLFGKAVRKSPA